MNEIYDEVLKAISEDSFDTIEEMIKNEVLNCNEKINGLSLLMLAAKNAALYCVTHFLKFCYVNEISNYYDDSDPNNIIDYRGKTALMFACEKGSYECVLQLLDNHANVYLQDNKGKYAFDYWLLNAEENSTCDIKYVLKKLSGKIEICGRAENLKEAIWHYDGRKLVEVTRLLCELGCNANNNEGKTPLHLVCEKAVTDECIKDTLEVLLSFGADPYLKGSYISAYEYAISNEVRCWMAKTMKEYAIK